MLHEFLNSTNESDIITQKLYGISKLDCDKYLPNETRNLMNSSTITDKNLEVPEIYLHKCLLDGYDADEDPYKLVPKSVTFNVTYTFAMNELLSIENEGTISMTARLFLRWFDPRFRWINKSSIKHWKWPTSIEILAHKIWIPKLAVQNCQKQNCPVQIYNRTIANIADRGRVWIAYSDLVQASCDVKLKNFPFDTQQCEVKIAFSNLGNNSYINQSLEFYVDYMVDNDEWMVTNIHLSEFNMTAYTFYKDLNLTDKWHRKLMPGLPANRTVPVFIFVVTAKRESGYFVTNLIVPILLVLCISIASLFIPPNLEDRYNVQMAVILSFVFFQSVLASVMPQTRGSPRLCRYVMYSMLAATVELIISFVLRGLDNLQVSSDSTTYKILDNVFIKFPDYLFKNFCLTSLAFLCQIPLKHQEPNDRTQNNSQANEPCISNQSSSLLLIPLAKSTAREPQTARGTQTGLCHSCSQVPTISVESTEKSTQTDLCHSCSQVPTTSAESTEKKKQTDLCHSCFQFLTTSVEPTEKRTLTDLCHSCFQFPTTLMKSTEKRTQTNLWHEIIQKRFNIISGILVLIFYIFVFCRYMGPLLYHFFKGLNATKFYYDQNTKI